MTVTAVITTPARDASAGLLPEHPRAILRSGLHVYRLYRIRIAGHYADYTFRGLDGEVLVQCNYFDDDLTARQWVAADIALRAERTEGVQ